MTPWILTDAVIISEPYTTAIFRSDEEERGMFPRNYITHLPEIMMTRIITRKCYDMMYLLTTVG